MQVLPVVQTQPAGAMGTRDTAAAHRRRRPTAMLALPREIVGRCLRYLPPEDLTHAEAVSRGLQRVVEQQALWRALFLRRTRSGEWRTPSVDVGPWKPFYFRYARETALSVVERISDVSVEVCWRVVLPTHTSAFFTRSREFEFSNDALGTPIRWQLQLDLHAAPDSDHQKGCVRVFTTNTWTPQRTGHYYGSHCTLSLRDYLNARDVVDETVLDIDNSQFLEFSTASVEGHREVVLKMTLTLALEVSVPLEPFYRLISKDASDAVKIGYCKAIFEIARCKRKCGSTFVQTCDSNVGSLIRIASDKSTSDRLRSEVFQALFNLLSPASVFIHEDLAEDLLSTCLSVLRSAPLPPPSGCRQTQQRHLVLAQNALGSIFNLLVHPRTREFLTVDSLLVVEKLLTCSSYHLCWFSVLTVLLTALNWGILPPVHTRRLLTAVTTYMKWNNPLDPDCTGVAWDETDIAAYFLPLLRSRHLACVEFARWCVSAYYFSAPPVRT